MNEKASFFQNINNWFNVKFYKMCGITIGKGTFIHTKAHLDVRRGKIILGENIFIDRDCFILSHIGFVPITEKTKPTIIEDGVFLFNNVTVYPEVTIGKNSLIYPGSVVTKNIPPDSIVLGNPGKIIGNKNDLNDLFNNGGIINEKSSP